MLYVEHKNKTDPWLFSVPQSYSSPWRGHTFHNGYTFVPSNANNNNYHDRHGVN